MATEEDWLAEQMAAQASPFRRQVIPESPFDERDNEPDLGLDTVGGYVPPGVRRHPAMAPEGKGEPNALQRGLHWLNSLLAKPGLQPQRAGDQLIGEGEASSHASAVPRAALNMAWSDIPRALLHSAEHYAGWQNAGLGEFDPSAVLVPPNPALLPGMTRLIARGEASPLSTWDHARAWLQNRQPAPFIGRITEPAVWAEEVTAGQPGRAWPHHQNPFSAESQRLQQRLEEVNSPHQWPRPPAFEGDATPSHVGNMKRLPGSPANDADVGLVKLNAKGGDEKVAALTEQANAPGVRLAYGDKTPEPIGQPRPASQSPFNREILERAIEEYPLTTSAEAGGYLTPEGKFLDFSFGQGKRAEDHRAANHWVPDEFRHPREGVGARAHDMDAFMHGTRSARWSPEAPGMEVNFMPTREQLRAVARGARETWPDRDFNVDVSNPATGEVVRSQVFERPPSFDQLNQFFSGLADEGVTLFSRAGDSRLTGLSAQAAERASKAPPFTTADVMKEAQKLGLTAKRNASQSTSSEYVKVADPRRPDMQPVTVRVADHKGYPNAMPGNADKLYLDAGPSTGATAKNMGGEKYNKSLQAVRDALAATFTRDLVPYGAGPTYWRWPKGEPRQTQVAGTEPPSPAQPRLSESVGELWAKSGDRFTAAVAAMKLDPDKAKAVSKALENMRGLDDSQIAGVLKKSYDIDPSVSVPALMSNPRITRRDAGRSTPSANREAREKAALTERFWAAWDKHAGRQVDVAKELGVTQASVSRWANPKSPQHRPRPTPQSAEAAAAEAGRRNVYGEGLSKPEYDARRYQLRKEEMARQYRERRGEPSPNWGGYREGAGRPPMPSIATKPGTATPVGPLVEGIVEKAGQSMRTAPEMARRPEGVRKSLWDEHGKKAAADEDRAAAQRAVDWIKRMNRGGE